MSFDDSGEFMAAAMVWEVVRRGRLKRKLKEESLVAIARSEAARRAGSAERAAKYHRMALGYIELRQLMDEPFLIKPRL
ncbi:MAG: hypothetical protein AB7O38_12575 [Pirellulaceae bacterium]